MSGDPTETLTLAEPWKHELVVKKSRFLAIAQPVASPEEAMAALARISDPSANHNCFAYRIGEQYRFSDDGEPGGTAGRPILAAVDGRGLDLVLVVVTRWFGGIKLGAGGLVRAYGGCASECLRTAPTQVVRARVRATLEAAFSDLGAVYGALERNGVDKLDEVYRASGVVLVVELDECGLPVFERALADATRGRVQPEVQDED